MNYTINFHGDLRVRIPSGLPELINDISKEVIRNKPINITFFIADYLDSKMQAREKAVNATDFVDDVLSEARTKILSEYEKYGLTREMAKEAATNIQALFKGFKARKSFQVSKKHDERDKIVERNSFGSTTGKSDVSSDTTSKLNYSIKYIKDSITSEGCSVMYMSPSILDVGEDKFYNKNLCPTDISSLSSDPPLPVRGNVATQLPKVESTESTKNRVPSNEKD